MIVSHRKQKTNFASTVNPHANIAIKHSNCQPDVFLLISLGLSEIHEIFQKLCSRLCQTKQSNCGILPSFGGFV